MIWGGTRDSLVGRNRNFLSEGHEFDPCSVLVGSVSLQIMVSPLCLYVVVRENVKPVPDSAVLGFMQKEKKEIKGSNATLSLKSPNNARMPRKYHSYANCPKI